MKRSTLSQKFSLFALLAASALLATPLERVEASVAAAAPSAGLAPSDASAATTPRHWTYWARKVGSNEDLRDQAIAQLKKEKNLESKMLSALSTGDRALALDVISAFQMKSLIAELLTKIEGDQDGFLTLTISSLLDEENKDQILGAYAEALRPDRAPSMTPAALIAMLEPLGRLGRALPAATLQPLASHPFPEVRSAVLSYLRILAMKYKMRQHDPLIVQALHSREFQIRLQALAFLTEIPASHAVAGLGTREELLSRCRAEAHVKVREHCVAFVRKLPHGESSRTPSAAPNKNAAPARPAAASCEDSYKTLYSKPTINVRMVFGYKDTRPARFVGDRHERIAFVQRLLKPCLAPSSNAACGFERSPENADLFAKTVNGTDGRPVRVQVWVAHSSVGSDDLSNRSDAFQEWQSNYAKTAFFTGLKEADVLFYNGHSRFGGGPDFEPPRLKDGDQVDTAYYQGQRPGLKKTVDVFQTQAFMGAESAQLRVLGLFSCGSAQHFVDEIRQYSDVGLISSKNLIYYADAIDNSISALSAMLERRCRKEFNSALRRGVPFKGMTLQGFLKN